MSIVSSVKTVTFRQPFHLPSVGSTLPPGDYQVTVESLIVSLHGQRIEQITNKLHVPAGTFGKSDLGSIASLSRGELEKALADDRNN